jgi:O-antigen ligase
LSALSPAASPGSESIGAAASFKDALLSTLSGREVQWSQAIALIRAHPLGSGHPFGAWYTAQHAHNDILERLVWGGPLMMLAYLAALTWIIAFVRTPAAPRLGLLLGVMMLVAGLTDMATLWGFVGAPALFLLGALIDRDWADGGFRLSFKD